MESNSQEDAPTHAAGYEPDPPVSVTREIEKSNLDESPYDKLEGSNKRDRCSAPNERLHFGFPHATLGQMAQQVQAKARAKALAIGTPEATKVECSYDCGSVQVCASGEENAGRWTKREHYVFLQALKLYGKEWKEVAKSKSS